MGHNELPNGANRSQHAITPGFVLYALRRWAKWTLTLGVLFAGGAAALIYVSYKPQYQSTTTLRIRPKQGVVWNTKPDAMYQRTLVAILKSPKVLQKAASDPEVASLSELQGAVDEVRELQRRLGIGSVGNSDLYTVKYRSDTAEGAQTGANAVVSAYLVIQKDFEDELFKDLKQRLDDMKSRRYNDLIERRKRVRALRQDLPPTAPAQSLNPSQLADDWATRSLLPIFQQRLVDMDLRIIERQTQIKSAEAFRQENPPKKVAAEEIRALVERNPQVEDLAKEIDEKEEFIRQDLLNRYQNPRQNATYREHYSEWEAMKERLPSLKNELETEITKRIEEQQKEGGMKELEMWKLELDGLVRYRQNLQLQFNEELRKLNEYQGESFDLEVKQKELALADNVYSQIEQRLEEVMDVANASSKVGIFENARKPSAPMEESPLKQLLVAVGVCFLIPQGLAFGWEFLHQRVIGGNQLQERLGANVIAEVSAMPSRGLNGRRTSSRTRMAIRCFRESVDGLRTDLVLGSRGSDVRIIAVTSSVSSEGKTTIATQLAISLAVSTAQRVLLIDGDVRSPDIHEIFEIQTSPGLAEVLQGSSSLREAVVEDPRSGVCLLPAGEAARSPHALFGAGKFEKLLEEARREYQFIVVDTPPILPASESLVQAKAADACVLCVRVNRSRLAQVSAAQNRLARAQVKMAGAAVVGVPLGTYNYQYGGYYHRGRQSA